MEETRGNPIVRTWPAITAWLISAASAAVVAFWGGQDNEGRFSIELLATNLPALLFFVGPYIVLAAAAWLARTDPRSALSVLAATALLAAIGVWAHWIDHDAALHTPPGRETTPMLGFLATLLLWLASGVLLLAVGIVHLSRRRAANRE